MELWLTDSAWFPTGRALPGWGMSVCVCVCVCVQHLPSSSGENPLELARINARMDYLLQGHPYVKSAVDVACWDVLGKVRLCAPPEPGTSY